MTDFSNVAAATAAGYVIEQGQQGNGGFYTNLVREGRGTSGEDGEDFEYGGHSTDQATQTLADSTALASLNAVRGLKYGVGEPAAPSLDDLGVAEVVDKT